VGGENVSLEAGCCRSLGRTPCGSALRRLGSKKRGGLFSSLLWFHGSLFNRRRRPSLRVSEAHQALRVRLALRVVGVQVALGKRPLCGVHRTWQAGHVAQRRQRAQVTLLSTASARPQDWLGTPRLRGCVLGHRLLLEQKDSRAKSALPGRPCRSLRRLLVWLVLLLLREVLQAAWEASASRR